MKPTLRISVLVSRLVIVCGVFASGSMARADSWDNKDGVCSNRMLRGDYGVTIEGQILAGPKAGPVRGVSMVHFDGRGEMRQVDHVVINGVPPPGEWSPASGTYTVNSDCTGKATLMFTDGRPPINMKLVVINLGKGIYTVTSELNIAATSIGTRVE
ncbi:MAG: hypothetical protein ABI833_21475 [Acidobacteriota bacterium]